jgi:hypothetical protein
MFSSDAAAPAAPRVVRKSDSVLNGALIGAGAAVGTGLYICTRMEPWEVCTGNPGSIVRLGLIGAGIGAAVDALIRRRVTIYETPDGASLHAAPIISRDTKGVRLSLTF